MTAPAQRSALAALDTARPIIARLDITRDPEDLAADLIEAWSAVETALRSLAGGSALSGQALIRELRQRQMLSLEQAHTLLEFQAARDRAEATNYHPTPADLAAARNGFLSLEGALLGGRATEPGAGAAPAIVPGPAEPIVGAGAAPVGVPRRRPGLWAAVGVAALVVIALLAWLGFSYFGRNRALERGVAEYQAGQRAQARLDFTAAAQKDPSDPLPHVYLARMAREEGDLPTAISELQTAIRLDPSSEIALREMGAVQLAGGNYDLARRFYVRALQLDPNDRNAQGFLGCTMIRLGQPDVGMRFLQRAGAGSWSSCAQAVPTMPGAMPPGSAPPPA